MKQPQYCGCESLSLNKCEITLFQHTGDTISWIQTKIVTYLVILKSLQFHKLSRQNEENAEE